MLLQSLDLLGQSNKFFSVLYPTATLRGVPSFPNNALSSSLRRIIRSAAASANIARFVLSPIDMFRNFWAPA